MLLFSLTEKILEKDLILASQHAERVPSGLSGRNWVRLDPATAGKLVEVLTRIDRRIH